MGALWCTQIASVIPTIKACAIAYPSYEQGEDTAFEMNSPTFKLRFMFMAGYENEAEFDKFVQGINAQGLGEKVTCPYLVCSGEDDDWSSIESTFAVLNDVKTPKELLLYQGEGHTLHSRPSSYLGPNEFVYMADWIADRFRGKPMESVLTVVDATGRIHRQPGRGTATTTTAFPSSGNRSTAIHLRRGVSMSIERTRRSPSPCSQRPGTTGTSVRRRSTSTPMSSITSTTPRGSKPSKG